MSWWRNLLGLASRPSSPERTQVQAIDYSARRDHSTAQWAVSENGNPTFEIADWRITVYPDHRGPSTLWKFCAAYKDEPFYSDHYFSEDDAKADAIRFYNNQPLLQNTYQSQRDSRYRADFPGIVSSERERWSQLSAKIERGRSKKENLLAEIDKRLSSTVHQQNRARDLGIGDPLQAELAELVGLYGGARLAVLAS